MPKDILKRINWKYFENHHIVQAFMKKPTKKEEELFKDNLRKFVEGDEDFREGTGIEALSDEEIERIISYLKFKLSRRKFVEGATAAAITAAVGSIVPKYLSALEPQIRNLNRRLAIKGVNYDIGTRYSTTFITRQELNTSIMQRELSVIKNQLNCNAVRIYGEDLGKLVECSKIALSYGLQVWLSPRLIDGSQAETLSYIRSIAAEVEKLRISNPSIILIVGNELTLDMEGITPGSTYQERGSNLFNHGIINKIKSIFQSSYNDQLNIFLKEVISIVRQNFKGMITYSAGNWEQINWEIFDIIGINKYLNSYNKNSFVGELRELKKFDKPIAILEFGCGSYKGAENKGGSSYDIVDWSKQKPEIKDNHIRDEDVQANYIFNLLNIFAREGIYATFIFTFVETHYTFDDNPKHDLDIASFNLIRVYPEWHEKAYIKGHIIPKKSFLAIAQFYATH